MSSIIIYATWEHFHSPKLGFRSNKSETYLKIQADFFSNFGLTTLFLHRGRGTAVAAAPPKMNTVEILDDWRFYWERSPSIS